MQFVDTEFLVGGEIKLVLNHTDEGDPAKNWMPAYHFDICRLDGMRMGVCDLRVGYTDGLYYGGHIGYRIEPEFQGHHYAAKACRLLFLLAQKHAMPYLIITCNPDNLPKTCEHLHGELPEDNDMRMNDGAPQKCIFRFAL